MSIKAVTEALKKLTNDDSLAETELNYFCVEDSFLSSDITVSVHGAGNIDFPISERNIQRLINISSKAVFGKGEKTVLDTNVRDTQTIPASKLRVDVNERSLAAVLKRIGAGLNINDNDTLVPHLYNMLIYGPGQFFDKHRDSEKIEKMVATLVLILPSHHKGGDLIIEHNGKRHTFFGSLTHKIIKCVAFYSDCNHEITKVTEGYRVALTFNVVLNSPDILQITEVDEHLRQVVAYYFRKKDRTRLIFYMNHSYSKCSLKWNLLKGSDRTRGHALFVVAESLGLKPCLALVEHRETYEETGPYDEELSETYIKPYFWVSWRDREWHPNSNFITSEFHEKEICYTIETSELLDAIETNRDGPYGNAPTTEERVYRRACVVLLRKKNQPLKRHQNKEESLPVCNERLTKFLIQLDEEELAGTSSIQNEGADIVKEITPIEGTNKENLTILPSSFYGKSKAN